MSLFDIETPPTPEARTPVPIPISDIDRALTAQIIVAWAGEGGEDRRLGWWRCDLVSEFGGEDLFRRLLPHTWRWAVLQGAREAARRTDAELRRQDHNPDRILSLFNLGFDLNERIEERFGDLKRAGTPPLDALPGLRAAIEPGWKRDAFLGWVREHHTTESTATPVGRRIKANPPSDLNDLVQHLVGALAPLADTYPLPHYRRAK